MELSDLRAIRFAVVDTETTGSRINGGDRVMEIGVVHLQDDAAVTVLDCLVNPQRPVSPHVARLTGIRWEMLQEAPTFADIADRLVGTLEGCVFVAQNVRFDWRFLSMELQRCGRRGLHGERLCTVRLARRVLSHLRRRNLDALAWHYEVPIVGRHRAGGDARATAQILQRMLADARRADVDTWAQLQAYLRQPRPRAIRSYLPQPMTGMEAIA